MSSHAQRAFLDACNVLIDLLLVWGDVPMLTTDLGDFLERLFRAEYQFETFAVSAGALGVDSGAVDVRQNVAEVKDISQGYAIEAWLARFPGFVDDLADRLRAYSAGLAGAVHVYAADRLEDEPLDPCGPYYVLLLQLRTSRNGGQVSEEDYEWFRTHARTAMAEVAKAALSGAPAAPAASAPSAVPAVVAPGPGPLPAVCFSPSAPAIQTLPAAADSGGSSSDEVVAVGRPVPRLLVSGGAPVVSGSGSHSRKRPRPTAAVPGQCFECKASHLRCKDGPTPGTCLRCSTTGRVCTRPPGVARLSPLGAVLVPLPAPSVVPSPSTSSAPSPASAARAAPSVAIPEAVFTEVAALGSAAYWRGEVVQLETTLGHTQSQLVLAREQYCLSMEELVLRSSRTVQRGSG
ncbi:hypothetical protein V8E53_005818, partial [Lactarius tabidus]